MLILKSQTFNDEELLEKAMSLSSKVGAVQDKLLFWEFGPLMNMSYDHSANNYLFSDEKVPFHWDGAFYKEPRLLLFYCTESEGQGGETLFTNTENIWEALTKAEKNLCSKVLLTYKTKKMAHYGGEITVPLVQKHPLTGKAILRMAERVETDLNPVELAISGVSDVKGFYDEMVAKLYDEKFIYSHEWSAGDLVIVDNFTYLHGRKELGLNRKRAFKRIQIM